MEIITQEQLQKLEPNKSISGILLIKNYDIQLTKNGKEYVVGSLQSGIDVPFKVWSNSAAFTKFKNESYENIPSYISGTVDGFGGINSIIIDTVQAVDGYTPDQFYPIRYNIDAYWSSLKAQIDKRVSEKGRKLCDDVLFNNDEVVDRFKKEFAATSHHDNCKGGLLAHTYKVINNMANIIATYPSITTKEGVVNTDFIDLLYIGCLLHDIGKIVEMNFGVYQPASIVTHRYLSIEFISPFKDYIIENYSEDWYYNLVSIMLQHHGDFDDSCRTVASYLVHRADELDSAITLLVQSMETVGFEHGSRIKFDGKYLVI